MVLYWCTRSLPIQENDGGSHHPLNMDTVDGADDLKYKYHLNTIESGTGRQSLSLIVFCIQMNVDYELSENFIAVCVRVGATGRRHTKFAAVPQQPHFNESRP